MRFQAAFYLADDAGRKAVDGVAQGDEFAVEEMPAFGDNDERDVLRGAPCEGFGDVHHFVFFAVDDEGFLHVGRGWRGQGVVVEGGADEQQEVGMARLGGEIGNVAAEREACDGEQGGLRVLGAGVVDDGDAVVGFAFALAVLPCAVACAAQVGQVAVKAHLREAFGGGLDDFVGKRAALGGVGVVNHGNSAFCALGGEVEGF